jgi:hypothetical protein
MRVFVTGEFVTLQYDTETKRMWYGTEALPRFVLEHSKHVLRLSDLDVNMIMLVKKRRI